MPQDPAERRVVVTGPPRRTRTGSRGRPGYAPGQYRPRTEIDEQTTLGHTYVRSLMRSQLRAALAAFAVLVLLVGPLPLLFAALPDARRLQWALLGFGLYAPLVLLARWYVRRAERNERDFVRLVEDR
ncbi:hypothetical protein [Streptomyces galbus]|uniref:DUF485 domain-containing protein n=1 Tax=Streptomyces galbus TaxID=33898 RepID=A0A4U5X4A9_STRGB|nr:hypothetical protein [Streptomyces galbus]TKT09959.1 hypothetical protein E4U92_10395 [Streptomyces galbus]GHD31758.1 hypothetical protein GCM10010335_22770 [Streptomyces galbus]